MDDFKVGDRVLWTFRGKFRPGTITRYDKSKTLFYKFEITLDGAPLASNEARQVRAKESEMMHLTELMKLIYD